MQDYNNNLVNTSPSGNNRQLGDSRARIGDTRSISSTLQTNTVAPALRAARAATAAGMAGPEEAGAVVAVPANGAPLTEQGKKIRALLRARLGEDVYTNWFGSMEFDSFDGKTVRVSVAVKFLKKWIQSHYADILLECCQAEFESAQRVDVVLRNIGGNPALRVKKQIAERANAARTANNSQPAAAGIVSGEGTVIGRTQVGGFEGSPLDPRYTFDSFVVGPANRMAHAGAWQVAETIFADDRSFNPLYLHSAVGLGKTHLLHAVAWEVKRRYPHANVLYLTAERFRYNFIEGLRSKDSLAFKEKFRSLDILLIDDLEFMSGPQTEQEFDHILNWLLDGGRQLVVASARSPNQLEKLNERMRSRLQRGLVTEISALDYDLRIKVLENALPRNGPTILPLKFREMSLRPWPTS